VVSLKRFVRNLYDLIQVPISIVFLLDARTIHPAYAMTWPRRLALGFRMFLNTRRMTVATSYKNHLAMALRILELPPDVAGHVVECGCYKGGSATNLSLVCRITGRKLLLFDSFQGLPKGHADDREASKYAEGDYAGSLEEVRATITRYGAIECVEFVPGWFDQTLPGVDFPIALLFLDVDLEASLNTCVRNLWPYLVDGGCLFTDEGIFTDYVALFWSERWWRETFATTPPGMIGSGCGLPLGTYYVGPWEERFHYPLQKPSIVAYTRKGMSGYWSFYPEDHA